MPIYEYECPKCGVFEVMQKVSDPVLKKKPDCTDPKCPKKAVKLVSAAAFHLKGTGWYKTDYATSSSASASPESSGSSQTKEGEGAKSGSGTNSDGEGAGKSVSKEEKPKKEKESKKKGKE